MRDERAVWSLLKMAFAVADGRISTNPAEGIKPPSGAHTAVRGSSSPCKSSTP